MVKKARRDKGSGGLYQRSNGLWVGVVELPDRDGIRRRRSVSSKDKRTAANKLRELQLAATQNPNLPSGSMTLERWLNYWTKNIAAGSVKPKTLRAYRDDVRLHIIPAIGRHRLDRLEPAHVRHLTGQVMSKGLSSTTALRCQTTLGIALTAAISERLITANVAQIVKRPGKANNPRGALTAEQAVHLVTHAAETGDELAEFYAAALLTGARRGELLGLQADRAGARINLAWQLQRLFYAHGCGDPTDKAYPCGKKRAGDCPNRYLEVPTGFDFQVLHGSLCLTRPKSKKGIRAFPSVEPLTSILARLQPGPHGLLWHTEGRPYDPNDVTKAWSAAVEKAGLPHVPLHAARHTTATLLREAGVPLDVIQQIVGHSSAATTLDYIHADDSLPRAALEGLGAALPSPWATPTAAAARPLTGPAR